MKKLFIGIDFSKKSFDVCVFSPSNRDDFHYNQFENNTEGYKSLLVWVKDLSGVCSSDWLFCGENTGLYSIGLTEFLLKGDYFMWLENAVQIKMSCGIKRQKSDKVDSREIALYAYRFQDRARKVIKPGKELSSLSLLLSFRSRLISNKNSLLVSAAEIRRVLKRDATARFIYERSYLEIERLNKEIKKVEEKIREVLKSSQELAENYSLITSIKGIGVINAVTILVYTQNFTVFDDPRKFACYAGVVPFEKSSGTSLKGKKEISRMANIQMKTLLTQAARSAVRHDKELKSYYQRKKDQGKADKLIINNVRNKLIARVFAVVRNKEEYKANYKNSLLKVA